MKTSTHYAPKVTSEKMRVFPRQQFPSRRRINLSWGTFTTEFFPHNKASDILGLK